jgi:hypothetical protein
MNILLWVLQAVLALLCVAGGYFKAFQFAAVAAQFPALPHAGWRALGVLEMACGILLIVPAAMKWMPVLTPLAAAVLVVETLALSVLYARYSTALTAENPLVFSVVMLILAGFVAYGRYALVPVT